MFRRGLARDLSAPFDQDIELSVIEANEVHALLFPCRRTARGWVNTSAKSAVSVTFALAPLANPPD